MVWYRKKSNLVFFYYYFPSFLLDVFFLLVHRYRLKLCLFFISVYLWKIFHKWDKWYKEILMFFYFFNEVEAFAGKNTEVSIKVSDEDKNRVCSKYSFMFWRGHIFDILRFILNEMVFLAGNLLNLRSEKNIRLLFQRLSRLLL